MSSQFDAKSLQAWFLENRRDLPWREDPTPYRVWISEVMLQQTRASVVIPYFERWMNHFPTINILAQASIEEVIKLWEGLGYYSRARNIHEAAKFLVERHGGQLPSDPHSLLEIRGLGPYTVGAIRSFAFHQKAAAVDGNVVRVLTRYFGIKDEVTKPSTLKKIWGHAEEILPDNEPWLVTEGLIELGASICGKIPRCPECPLRHGCVARGGGPEFVASLPYKEKKIKITPIYRVLFLLSYQDRYLVGQVEEGKIMAGLYEFPYLELPSSEINQNVIEQHLSTLGLSFRFIKSLSPISHTFTRFKATLFPVICEIDQPISIPNYEWVDKFEFEKLPFSSGHRKVLTLIL
jgi:A/G-specific adenine glycosylase